MPIAEVCLIVICTLLAGGAPRECVRTKTLPEQPRACLSLERLDTTVALEGTTLCFEVEEAQTRDECRSIYWGLAAMDLRYHRAMRFEWVPRPKSTNEILSGR